MDAPATTAQIDATAAVLEAVGDFLGGPHEHGDGWCFEFGHHLEANWGTVYGGALAASTLAVARDVAPDRVPCSVHLQMIRSVPAGATSATVSVRHAGRTVSTVEVNLFDPRGKPAVIALATMVNPAAVAADLNDARATPFETSPFEVTLLGKETAPIVDAIATGLREPDGSVSTAAYHVTNRRPSVEGSLAVWSTCVVPWDDLDHTGPEAACLLADTMVGFPILQSSLPDEAHGPNPDLTLRFTTAPATKVLTGASMLLSVQHGTVTTGIEVHAGDQQLAHGLATSLLLDRQLSIS